MTLNVTTSAGNHQRRVGVERRERTRALLIRSAIEVFARRRLHILTRAAEIADPAKLAQTQA